MKDANTGRIEDGWNLVYGGSPAPDSQVSGSPAPASPHPALPKPVRTPDRRVRTVLVVADEWFPARGGLSALNRYLCRALASAGVDVFCLVPGLTDDERRDMEDAGVRPIIALRAPGMTEREALVRRPVLPDGVEPDLVVGHGRVTGPVAKALAEDLFGGTPRLHLVHMSPEEIEWHKLDGDSEAGTRATERTAIELGLAAGAAAVVPVGPRLYEWIVRDLDDGITPVVPLDPGFDQVGPDERAVPKGERRPLIMIMGRMDDARLKGVELAARAVGHARRYAPDADDWELLVRGTPAETEAETRKKVVGWIGHRTARVMVQAFDPDIDAVRRDLRRASLLLMPSLVEGYGLVGHEAITMGTPALVSEHSGLGMLLTELAPRESRSIVVPVRDTPKDAAVWGHRIAAELRDRPAAFARATALRRHLAARWTWADAVERILSAL
ncbi:hypothetical protein GCM10010177_79480 [Actinomadura citrea]|nr:hypothetical protein GCM10010177_79480 [Actinomadura citrea]